MATTIELHRMLMDELGVTTQEDQDKIYRYWSLYESETVESVRYLRVKLHALEKMMAQARTNIDLTVGTDKLNASQIFKHLETMWRIARESLNAELPNGSTPTIEVSGASYIPED